MGEKSSKIGTFLNCPIHYSSDRIFCKNRKLCGKIAPSIPTDFSYRSGIGWQYAIINRVQSGKYAVYMYGATIWPGCFIRGTPWSPILRVYCARCCTHAVCCIQLSGTCIEDLSAWAGDLMGKPCQNLNAYMCHLKSVQHACMHSGRQGNVGT